MIVFLFCFFFTENKESREVQQKTIFQLESDKFRLEEELQQTKDELQQTKDELQQTKDELQQTKEDNERLNERLTHVADTPTTLLPSTSTTTPNGECDVNTTTASSQNKSLNSKILLRIIFYQLFVSSNSSVLLLSFIAKGDHPFH